MDLHNLTTSQRLLLLAACLGIVGACVFWLGGQYTCWNSSGTYFPNMKCTQVEVLKAECWTSSGELALVPTYPLVDVLENFTMTAEETLLKVSNASN